jgi:gliding motility-associated lipoprotein GldD
VALNLSGLPCGFNISTQAAVEMSPDGSSPYGFNIDYPNLHAKIYCSYQPVTPRTFRERENECRRLVERTAGKAKAISEQFYENKDRHVYGSLFRINGETPAPVQFILTDSVSGIFRGALYHEYGSNVDSLAPVTEYIREDIIELFLTFYWKK